MGRETFAVYVWQDWQVNIDAEGRLTACVTRLESVQRRTQANSLGYSEIRKGGELAESPPWKFGKKIINYVQTWTRVLYPDLAQSNLSVE